MDWTIHPHIGVGTLRFGMLADEVLRAAPELGFPKAKDKEFDGSIREFRSIHLPLLFYVDGKLSSIDCNPRTPTAMPLQFEEVDVFATEPEMVFRRLYERNGQIAHTMVGSIFFHTLGINTGGFYNFEEQRYARLGDSEGLRGMAICARGAFDGLFDSMKPFELP